MSTSLRSVGLLDVLSSTSPGPSVARLVSTPVSTASRRTLVKIAGSRFVSPGRQNLTRAAFAALLALLSCASCGPKSFAVGTVPFPAPKPVIADSSGQPRAGFPDSPEPFRIVLLDYVWCPPCDNVWKAIRDASRQIPEGSVHVYRILFDRERLLHRERTTEVAPLSPPPPADAGTLPVTTVVALPRPFREQFSPEQGPVLLLTDRAGKVLKRWTGASPSLSAAIVSEVRRVSNAPPLPGT